MSEEKKKRKSKNNNVRDFVILTIVLCSLGFIGYTLSVALQAKLDNQPPKLSRTCELFNSDGVGVRIEVYYQKRLISERQHRIFYYTEDGETWREWFREGEDPVSAAGAYCQAMTVVDQGLVYYFWNYGLSGGTVGFYDGQEFYSIMGSDITNRDCLMIQVKFENIENGEIKLRCPDYDQDDNYTYLIAKSNDRGRTWILADD
jgi:hypothetical protein